MMCGCQHKNKEEFKGPNVWLRATNYTSANDIISLRTAKNKSANGVREQLNLSQLKPLSAWLYYVYSTSFLKEMKLHSKCYSYITIFTTHIMNFYILSNN